MTTEEGLDIYSGILTRQRQLELNRLKKENEMLRALVEMYTARIQPKYDSQAVKFGVY